MVRLEVQTDWGVIINSRSSLYDITATVPNDFIQGKNTFLEFACSVLWGMGRSFYGLIRCVNYIGSLHYLEGVNKKVLNFIIIIYTEIDSYISAHFNVFWFYQILQNNSILSRQITIYRRKWSGKYSTLGSYSFMLLSPFPNSVNYFSWGRNE